MAENLDKQVLWNEVMTLIRSEIGERDFERWFDDLTLEGFSSNQITISSTPLHIDQLKSRFGPVLESSIRSVFGEKTSIKLESRQESSHQKNNAPVHAEKAGLPETKPASPAKPHKTRSSFQFKEEFSFENYVVGENNNFAFQAALGVSKNPGTTRFNPLFIYGGVGLGKTHLIQAIGNALHNDNKESKIIYVSAEAFTNEFIESINKKDMVTLRRKYRQADLLLVDDLHTLEKKPGCQEELFNTFNALISSKKQMVFTCDRPVTELKDVAERLTSRLQSGVQIDIQIPQYETRYAILKKRIEAIKISIPDEVIDLICKNITTNVRDMIGALNKLLGYVELTRDKITFEIAKDQLKDIFASPKQSNMSIDNIQQVVANYFKVSIGDLKGKKRTQSIVYPRQLSMYIAMKLTEFSTTEVGELFGGRDHTTVLHAQKKIEGLIKNDPNEEHLIETLIKSVKEYSVK